MRPLDELRPRIRSLNIPYPAEIFGDCNMRLKPIPCVITDILETMAAMLVNSDVVGSDGSKFQLTYQEEYNADGEQTYGNVTSALWFKRAQKAIMRRWGPNVYLLAFLISCDKTHVDRVGGISVWPCYITILNLDSSVRRTAKGSDIIGYVPLLPYSDSQLKRILKLHCGVHRDFKDVIKMCKYYIEQSFYNDILEPVRERETEGPILLQIGQNVSNVHRFIPKLMCYTCKLNHLKNVFEFTLKFIWIAFVMYLNSFCYKFYLPFKHI